MDGEASSELGCVLAKFINKVLGSKLLGYLHEEQQGSTREFALNCLCKAIKEGDFESLEDRKMLNTMTLLCEHGLKSPEMEVHNKAIELLKLVFCSPTRAGVFDTSKVKFSDVQVCLRRLVGLVARRGCFDEGEEEGMLTPNDVAKACIVSLARQTYIGGPLLASVIEDDFEEGVLEFDIICGNLLITEALIAEYGDLDDTKVDKIDIEARLQMAMNHINKNVRNSWFFIDCRY